MGDVAWIDDLSVDLDRIAAAVGDVPRVAYEAVHVYPLSAPRFTPSPGTVRKLPDATPLRLYVHIPFCSYACSFCFYAKRIGAARDEMWRYVDALERELDQICPGTGLQQLYLGGGTPTVLPPDLLDHLLKRLTVRLQVAPGSAHTIESSPESLHPEHIEAARKHGVGRISLGVQTLDESILARINRYHSAGQARAACALLVASGLSVNVDLIYGFPGQTEDSLRHDIAAFAGLGVHSFAVYNLRLNQHTPLARVAQELRAIELPSLMRWRRCIERTMAGLGYEPFRWHMYRRRDLPVSGHHRAPGLNGFGSGAELGIGASAYSHLGETIYRNSADPRQYRSCIEGQSSPVVEVFPFSDEDRRCLFVAQTIGDRQPLRLRDYEQGFGRRFEEDFAPALSRLSAAGLIRVADGEISVTEVGGLVYDLVTLAFYPDAARQWLRQQQSAVRAGSASATTPHHPDPKR